MNTQIGTLFGAEEKYKPHTVKVLKNETLSHGGCHIEVRPKVRTRTVGAGRLAWHIDDCSETWTISRLTHGGFEITGAGFHEVTAKSITKARKMINLMAQEYEYQRCDA